MCALKSALDEELGSRIASKQQQPSTESKMKKTSSNSLFVRTAAILAVGGLLSSANGQGLMKGTTNSACGDQPCPGGTAPTTPLQYFGSPLLTGAALTSAGGGPTVYVIWYGNWNQNNGSDTPAGQQIVYDFLYGVAIGPYSAYGSPYYSINSTLSTNPFAINGKIAYGGSCAVGYLFGTTVVADDATQGLDSIVSYAICGTNPQLLPDDPNGVYLIIGSSDVDSTSRCCGHYGSGFCGLYGYGRPDSVCGNTRVLMWEQNAGATTSKCKPQAVGPNGNAGVDGMMSTLAHDLADAINNGFQEGWRTAPNGADSGNDGCNGTYGQNMQQVSIPKYGRPYYNITLPSPNTGPGAPAGYRHFLVSRLVAHNVTVNGVTGDYCAVSYDPITGAITQ
jgi:hypothetical protein